MSAAVTTSRPTTAPRERTLALLAWAGLPLIPEQLAELAALGPNRGLAPSQLRALLAHEEWRWARDPAAASVWLVPTLDADDGSRLPRYLARSDWPLADRLVGGLTPRVLTLRLLLRLLEGSRAGEATSRRARLVGRLARTVPDAGGPDGTLVPDRIGVAVRAELAVLATVDAAERRTAAARLATRPLREQLWG